jgi:hypothetical protein
MKIPSVKEDQGWGGAGGFVGPFGFCGFGAGFGFFGAFGFGGFLTP